MEKVCKRRSAPRRSKFDEIKFFAYLKEHASSSLRDLLLSIDRRAWIEMSAYVIRYLRRSEEDDFFLKRKRRATQLKKSLAATIHNLEKALAAYKELAMIEIPEVGKVGASGTHLWPKGEPFFGDVIEAEVSKLRGLLATRKEQYNDKRFGVSANHTWLAILEEFTCAWTERELGFARKLRAHEIADLITAAKATLGWREKRTETDPELISKAIRKFRANPANVRLLSRAIVPYVQNRCEVVAQHPYLLRIEI
jgi:hypothetical protein